MLSNGNITEDNKTFINLKLISTPGPTEERPMFVVLGDDFKPTSNEYSKVKGKLLKIKGSHTPAKGRMGDVYGFKAFLEDGDEIYVVESTINNSSKDLLNSLLPNIGKVLDISLYINKNGYPTSSVKNEAGAYVETAFEFNKTNPEELYGAIAVASPEKEENSEEINVEDISF